MPGIGEDGLESWCELQALKEPERGELSARQLAMTAVETCIEWCETHTKQYTDCTLGWVEFERAAK